jgi:hypothetical protein
MSFIRTAERRAVYGSLFLMICGATLLWTCHYIQFRYLLTQIKTAFVYFEGPIGDRLFYAGSRPYTTAFIGIYATGFSLLLLGMSVFLYLIPNRYGERRNILFIFGGILIILPQIVLLHGVAMNSSTPQASFIAGIICMSMLVISLGMIGYGVFRSNPPAHMLGSNKWIVTFTKALIVMSIALGPMSFYIIIAGHRLGLDIYITSYVFMWLAVIVGIAGYAIHKRNEILPTKEQI